MKPLGTRLILRALLFSTGIYGFGLDFEFSLAQSPGETEQSPGQNVPPSSDAAEHDKIWNSKEMLEARAHLKTTFERSAKITPEQADKYMADLEALSSEQLKAWLLNFQQERARNIQQNERERQLRRQVVESRSTAQQGGGFRNPTANRRTVSSGLPVMSTPQPAANRNVFAASPRVQKPFSDPSYQRSVRPLVTSEDAARYQILRGIGTTAPFPIY
ncbi:hypothetical protein [Bythopirellula goksoeyrii]|uniref:Uncharacterized protein n=1 Tax=Bythopirellula goksoeyrii TaxID=1400387 RepID=A0A5B9QDD1_9BACT|nr:hypothetical protein [Bythopirellula goksoeyrii]QEG35625.1 hypothetical protein Pr1d_29270 [Bythopirellula goksoeyrii]